MQKLQDDFERLTLEISIKKDLKQMAMEFQRNQNKCDKLLELHKKFSKMQASLKEHPTHVSQFQTFENQN